MVTIQINDKTAAGKDLVKVLKALPYIKVLDEEKSTYNPEFVKKILKADKRGKYITLDNSKTIWENLGLK